MYMYKTGIQLSYLYDKIRKEKMYYKWFKESVFFLIVQWFCLHIREKNHITKSDRWQTGTGKRGTWSLPTEKIGLGWLQISSFFSMNLLEIHVINAHVFQLHVIAHLNPTCCLCWKDALWLCASTCTVFQMTANCTFLHKTNALIFLKNKS